MKGQTVNVIGYVNEQELVSLTQSLVRIESVYRPGIEGGNETKVAAYVADYLRNLGLEVHVEEVVPGRPNVIAILDSGKPGKTLLYEAHTDVVTEGVRSSWTFDPFGAEIRDGKLYGRGTCDTKGNLACAITAVRAVKESGVSFSGKILLCIPCDEEGMMIGIKDFIRRGWADGVDGAIICEPVNNVGITQKGAMRAVVKTYGKMSHGAQPLAGINPNIRMARLLVELDRLEQKEKERLGKHPMLGWPSITPTILQAPVEGEAQINVMPDTCMTTLDIRTIPGQDHETLKQEIYDIFQRLAESDVHFKASMEVIEERPWTLTNAGEAVVSAVEAAYETVKGVSSRHVGVPGATDGTFLHMAGVPIVTIGAGPMDIPHQADEYVEIDDLIQMTKIYAAAVANFLGD